MTGLLFNSPLTPQQSDFVETIRSSGDALLTIINDILDFSKIEAGRLDLSVQHFSTRDAVETALNLVGSKAATKGLEIGCMFAPRVPMMVLADPTRLRQILLNLLANAVKFTPGGEIVVSVTARPVEPEEIEQALQSSNLFTLQYLHQVIEGGQVFELHFAVRDTGIGIAADRMDQLFKAFSQLDTSATRRFGGTGLGLAISKRLTEMQGGKIWVESEVGQGSTFHFTLLVCAIESEIPVHLRDDQPLLFGKRVLLVDDHPTSRQILGLLMQGWGMNVSMAESEHEALEYIWSGHLFQVALIDMDMPEMNGLVLAHEIRRFRTPRQLPLILITTLADLVLPENLEDFSATITKPARAAQLHDILVRVFSGETNLLHITAPRPETSSAFEGGMSKRFPMRILLVEDNLTNQKLALLILERLGYHVDLVVNGLEAIHKLRETSYDVLLMDVQMPEMNGLDATRVIRKTLNSESQPYIIAMTANAMREDRDSCLEAGMDDYIAKPIQIEEIIAALQKASQQRSPSGEELAYPSPAIPNLEPAGESLQADFLGEISEASFHEAPVFDPKALQRLRNSLGKQADSLLSSLIHDFYADAEKLLADARQAFETGRVSDLRLAAHTLKSNSATFGAMKLSILSKTLEFQARDGALADAEALLERLEQAYRQVIPILDEAIKPSS